MKKLMFLAGLTMIGFGATSGYVHAEQFETSSKEGVHHYKGEKIESAEQGFDLLDKEIERIGVIMEKEGELEFTELESIHEVTYTMENVVDYFRANNSVDAAKIDAVDEAVQAIHYSSENQEEEKLREWFPKLKVAAASLKDAPVVEAAAQDAAPVKQDFYEIVIKDHKFEPAEIVVPAGEKIKLIVKNEDPTPEEFESHDMNREKIIAGNKKATIFVGPLQPGKYHFFGEFNMDTANGYIIAK